MAMISNKITIAGVEFNSVREFCGVVGLAPSTKNNLIKRYGTLLECAFCNIGAKNENELQQQLVTRLNDYRNDPSHIRGAKRANSKLLNDSNKIALLIVIRYTLSDIDCDNEKLCELVRLGSGIDLKDTASRTAFIEFANSFINNLKI